MGDMIYVISHSKFWGSVSSLLFCRPTWHCTDKSIKRFS